VRVELHPQHHFAGQATTRLASRAEASKQTQSIQHVLRSMLEESCSATISIGSPCAKLAICRVSISGLFLLRHGDFVAACSAPTNLDQRQRRARGKGSAQERLAFSPSVGAVHSVASRSRNYFSRAALLLHFIVPNSGVRRAQQLGECNVE
jgi:hypothetical protein